MSCASWADPLTQAWALAEPLLWMFTTALTLRIWLRMRAVRQRSQVGAQGPPLVLNLSGHPLAASEAGWAQGIEVRGRVVEWDAGSAEALDQSVQAAIRSLEPSLRARLLAGDPNLFIALPGLAPAVFHLLVHLHGLMGHFPTVTYPLRVEGGYLFVRPVIGQDLRMLARGALRAAM